jgi:putative membrane protein
MNAVAQIFALIEAMIFIAVFLFGESLSAASCRPEVVTTPAADVPAVMMWAIPTGGRTW